LAWRFCYLKGVRTRLLLLPLALALAGCKGSGSTNNPPGADAGTEAGNDSGTDGGIPCGPSGISKGPWTLAVDATHAKVRWEACASGTPPAVAFAPETGGAEQKVDATETPTVVTTSKAAIDPMIPPDLAGTWYMHEAALTGLTPATCYAYRLLADAAAKGRFCTARNPGDAIRFMAIGDTNPGLGDNTTNVLIHTIPKNPDFVLHGGDIQYYSSAVETWASWFPLMAPMLRQGAFFPAIGNHESETPTEFTEYTERFFGGAGFDGTEAYFRIESGGVWFFSIDTEEPLDLSTTEGAWLASSMADAAAKPGYRFGVVYFHRPFVTCGDTGDNPTARAEFEPLFLQNHVPLVLQAHMHGYERFDFPGITYVTTAGGGGNMGNPDANTSRPYCGSRVASGAFFHATIVDVSASGAEDAGVVDASASDGGEGGAPGATLTGTVIDDKGAVRDSFVIGVR
jgi:hypothetical protein